METNEKETEDFLDQSFENRFVGVLPSSDKIFKIGIDRISLYNFEIEISPQTKRRMLCKMSDGKGYEKDIIKTEWCSIVNGYYLKQVPGEKELRESIYRIINLNPNKILYGNNVGNATPQDLKKALDKLQEYLEMQGITVDFSKVKIKEIEINVNIPKNFKEFSEVFRLIMKQTKEYQEINGLTGSFVRAEWYRPESFFSKINKNTILRIYDKALESTVDMEISRIEFLFKKGSFEYYLKKHGMENELKNLLENPNILKEIFIDKIEKLFKSSRTYIEKTIKRDLEVGYTSFKYTAKFAKENNRKAHRGIYDYLEKIGIFDYNILIELTRKYNTKNFGREKKIIEERFSHINNIEKLNYLINYIYNTNR